MAPGWGHLWPQGHNLNKYGRGLLGDAVITNIKALGLLVSDKKIFQCFSYKDYVTVGPILGPKGIICTHLVKFTR